MNPVKITALTGVACLLASLSGTAARAEVALPDCPAGTHMAGAPPPLGTEVYCQKPSKDGAPVRHGLSILFYEGSEQVFQQGEFIDGRKHGTWLGFHKNGKLFEKAQFKNGLRQGIWLMHDQQGRLRFEGHYQDDRLNGLASEWYESGQLSRRVEYRKGRKHGKGMSWYPSGALQGTAEFKDDLLDGREVLFHENGLKRRETLLRDGKPTGLVSRWDKEGRKVSATQ